MLRVVVKELPWAREVDEVAERAKELDLVPDLARVAVLAVFRGQELAKIKVLGQETVNENGMLVPLHLPNRIKLQQCDRLLHPPPQPLARRS
jgi:hypothetical protein